MKLRFSTLPFANFQNNLNRAKALANLDRYVLDMLQGGGKTIGRFNQLPNQIWKILGIDKIMKEEMKGMQKRVKEKLTSKLASLEELGIADELHRNIATIHLRLLRRDLAGVLDVVDEIVLERGLGLRSKEVHQLRSAYFELQQNRIG